MRSTFIVLSVLCAMCPFRPLRATAAYDVCNGNESTLAPTWSTTNHNLVRYMDYPLVWSRCAWEYEDDSFDAHDEALPAGNPIDYMNCAEFPNANSSSYTVSVKVTTSLSVGGGTSIAVAVGAALGWEKAGSVNFSDTTSVTLNWDVVTAQEVSGSYTRTIAAGAIPADTHWYHWDTVTYAFRRGGLYVYYQGTVWDWCTTHSLWGDSYADQIDYYSHSVYDTKYVIASGERADSCQPCSCSKSWSGTTFPYTSSSPITYTAGQKFVDY